MPCRSPERIASKASAYLAAGKRWVTTGATFSPLWSMATILYQVSNISRP